MFDESSLGPDPFKVFDLWYKEICQTEETFPDAMALATVDSNSKPRVRTVLYKGNDGKSIQFVTNYSSHKGAELEAHPYAEVCFHWKHPNLQARIAGKVEKFSREESVEYFKTRPRGSQIGAHASDQSAPLESREALQEIVQKLEVQYDGEEIPCPEDWGGYHLIVERFEFWMGREDRLHDRFEYVKDGSSWKLQRLCP